MTVKENITKNLLATLLPAGGESVPGPAEGHTVPHAGAAGHQGRNGAQRACLLPQGQHPPLHVRINKLIVYQVIYGILLLADSISGHL